MNALVLIPTYNERDNLAALVSGVLAHPQTQVLVIDDASPDGTGELAEQLSQRHVDRVDVMHRTGVRGLGRAYLDGLRMALERNIDLIVQMDADWSHDPKYLPAFFSAASRGAGLTIGSRYVPGGAVENWPLRRRMLSAAANRYIRATTGLTPRDCTSGFRCWQRDALARVALERVRADGYSFLVELTYRARAAGIAIAEVPITFVERRYGRSKLSATVLLESLTTPWRLALAEGRLRRPHATPAAGALRP